MRLRCRPKEALGVALLLMLQPRIALGQDPACRSSSDLMYAVKRGETLSEVAARFYCVAAEPAITHVWEAVYDYNRVVAGRDPHAVPVDMVLCLPAHVDGTGWSAARCVASERSAPTAKTSGCGNDEREASEICDGADLAGMTCATLGLPAGKLRCRADCAGFDPAGCGQAASALAQVTRAEKGAGAAPVVHADETHALNKRDDRNGALTPKRERLLRRISVEFIGGVAVPFSAAMWDHFYRVLGMTGVSARVTLGWIEVAPRALLIGGQHGTIFNDVEEQQRVLGGGLSVQAGVPLRVGPVRLTPGVEVGWLYLHRDFTQTVFPFERESKKQFVNMPLVGIFVRPEYTIPGFTRASVALEFGGDLLPIRFIETGVAMNINAKVLGGLGYVF